MSATHPELTLKGAATRERIVRAAADLVLERGAEGTTLDDVRAATATSKSQLFHYFPGGKGDLISAIGALQIERVLEAQRPYLDELDTWASWDRWRDAVLAHYGAQPHWGCPIGALTAELVRSEPDRAPEAIAHMERWRHHLEAGLARMAESGLLRADTDPRTLSLSVFAALQGGLTLSAMAESIEPLQAALDGALATLHASAASRDPGDQQPGAPPPTPLPSTCDRSSRRRPAGNA
jgi:AcrR family transcriptional regulator